MHALIESLAMQAFQRTAGRVPAYQVLLQESGISPREIRALDDFSRLPVLNKESTFRRFPIAQLCVDGQIGSLGAVLTSSGHSGIFAFGLHGQGSLPAATQTIDDALDHLFSVRSRKTLLINCLPMGVRVPTEACTLADTSVRPDMATALVRAFAGHFQQFIFVGEAAFIKHTLEIGRAQGIDWSALAVQVIVGEEPLAENARKYLDGILGIDSTRQDRGVVASSMGIAEFGLNLFFELPPRDAMIIRLRRALHESPALRQAVLGAVDWVPSIFTYDPRRILVEFGPDGRMILSTLDPQVTIPLIRYATGDQGRFLSLPSQVFPELESAGISCDLLAAIPLIAVSGRGEHARAGSAAVYPEAVKEGLYHDPSLAVGITANFRLVSGPERALIRIQCVPGVAPDARMEQRFSEAIARYVHAPFLVACENYETFGSGMALDYERKFGYLKN